MTIIHFLHKMSYPAIADLLLFKCYLILRASKPLIRLEMLAAKNRAVFFIYAFTTSSNGTQIDFQNFQRTKPQKFLLKIFLQGI